MADIDLFDKVGGVQVPVDPMELLNCDSCQ